jgi:hypothetical protein
LRKYLRVLDILSRAQHDSQCYPFLRSSATVARKRPIADTLGPSPADVALLI